MRTSRLVAAALATAVSGIGAANAESFLPDAEDTGMSWKAWQNEAYTQQRSRYLYPGGRVPGQAYSAPGLVYGGAPPLYDPYRRVEVYVPGGTYYYYQPYPPGY
jgi:hypothetical protein